MAILLDTNAIAWAAANDRRLGRRALAAIVSDEAIFVSAITAYEFADLNKRGRFDADLPLADVIARLRAEIVDFPTACWGLADELPDLHRDPVDRMLIAHALHEGWTLVTSDATMRAYPVRTLW